MHLESRALSRRMGIVVYALLSTALFPSVAFADRVTDLYNFTVPFAKQTRTDADIENASKRALEAVLLRVSGLPSLPQSQGVTNALRNAQTLVLQSRMSAPDSGSSGDGRVLITIYFDPAKIHELLRSLGLPLWPANRPSVLILGAVQDDNHRYMMSSNANDEITRRVRSRAVERGLPLVFPLMDVVDLRHVNMSSIAGGFLSELRTASERYPVDATAVVLIQPHVFGRYRTHVIVWIEDREQIWVHDSEDVSQIAVDLVDRIVDLFVSKYAVSSTSSTDISMTVVGIKTLQDYRRLYSYLEQWDFVEKVNIEKINIDRFTLKLRTSSSLEQLVTHFSSERLLQLDPTVSDRNVFKWLGSN